MSYTIELIPSQLPPNTDEAWAVIERLSDSSDDEHCHPHPSFIRLHAALTAKYRCLSSYGDDEEADECPWADGPMLGNFGTRIGMLALLTDRVDELLPFIIQEAGELGISVADGQTGQITRPASISNSTQL
jgi:hypothetical protein